jgi:hypothetical protein
MRPVFPVVVGCPRSGTTLVRAILDSHPDLMVVHESSFWLLPLWRRFRRYQRESTLDAEMLAGDLATDHRFARLGVRREDLASTLSQGRPRDFTDVARLIFSEIARANGKIRCGDKTPRYVQFLPRLARLLPEARFLHVIRDGRDVALSLVEMKWGPPTIQDAALHWRHYVKSGMRAGSRLGRTRYLECRYEQLIENPEDTVKLVCRFFELTYFESMLRYYERADAIIRPTSRPKAHQRLRMPLTAGIRDWRSTMAEEDVSAFEALAGDLLAELGYPLRTDGGNLRVRARARYRRLRSGARWGAARALRALRPIGRLPADKHS